MALVTACRDFLLSVSRVRSECPGLWMPYKQPSVFSSANSGQSQHWAASHPSWGCLPAIWGESCMTKLLCPRSRIPETAKEPTPMQSHKGLLQARAWVQVYPTQRSRDLDPEIKRLSNFIGASGQWDMQKVAQSCWSSELDFRLGCALVSD